MRYPRTGLARHPHRSERGGSSWRSTSGTGASSRSSISPSDELRFLLRLSADVKAAKYGGHERPRLTGKNIALIFEKSSTRTRTAFEVAPTTRAATRSR